MAGPVNARMMSALLDRLYENVLAPDHWGQFLADVTAALGAQSSGIVAHDFGSDDHAVALSFGMSHEVVRAYGEHFGEVDIWAQKGIVKPGSRWVAASDDLCPRGELLKSEFYWDFLRSANTEQGLFALINRQQQIGVSLSLYRDDAERPFTSGEPELLMLLLPHLERALLLQQKLAALQAQTQVAEEALGSTTRAVFCLNAQADLLYANPSALQIAAAGRFLRLKQGRLTAARGREQDALCHMVAGVARSGAADAMTLHDLQGRALEVWVVPSKSLSFDLCQPFHAGSSGNVLLFAEDPARRTRPKDATLKKLFGLSSAECRLAMLLADGQSPNEICQTLNVSRNTLKSQLAAVYGKVGVSRQAELVRRLVRLTDAR